MTDVIDHLYRKAIEQDYSSYEKKWGARYQAIKDGGYPVEINTLDGPAGMAESLRMIISAMAKDIAELQRRTGASSE